MPSTTNPNRKIKLNVTDVHGTESCSGSRYAIVNCFSQGGETRTLSSPSYYSLISPIDMGDRIGFSIYGGILAA